MLERQLRPAQDFIENPLRHPQHQSRKAGSCLGAQQTIRVFDFWSTISNSLASRRELGSLAAVRVWSLLWLFRDPASGDVNLTREEHPHRGGAHTQAGQPCSLPPSATGNC